MKNGWFTLFYQFQGFFDVGKVLLFRHSTVYRHYQHGRFLNAPHMHRVPTGRVQCDVLYTIIDRTHCKKYVGN